MATRSPLRIRAPLCAALLALCFSANGQVPQVLATRCEHPPKLDGNLQDPAWLKATAAKPFLDPFTNKPADDQTEAWIVYDDEAIYVAFYCHDSKPDQIVGREINPESTFNGEDTVQLEIDPYGTRSAASLSKFKVNAINTRTESIAGGHASKAEWRGIWQSCVKRVPDGYIVEVRIPWKILSYPRSDKPLDMDVDFDRYQQRTKTLSQWANVTPGGRADLMGIWKGVSPPLKDARSRLQFLAYDAPQIEDGVFSNRAGLDVRYAVTHQQTALLSINPDFVNIEQQIAGISFVHTERFLMDARPFFTEGADYFNPVGMFEWGFPFYSQRIGPLNVGSKYYGQLSPRTQLGVLAMNQADGSTAAFGNYAVNNGPTFNDSTFATSFDGNGIHDRLLGTKAHKRWGPYFFADIDAAVEDTGHGHENAGNFDVGYGGEKLYTSAQYEWVDPSFNPPLAYVPWQDRRGFYTYNNYNDTIPHGFFHDWNGFVYTPDFYMTGGVVQERGVSAGVQAVSRNDQSFGVTRNLVDYQTGTDDNWDVSYIFNASNRFKQAGVEYLFGRQNGMPSRFLDLKGSLRVLRKIDLGLEQSVLVFAPDARQTIATIGWQFDSKRSLTGRYVDTNGFKNFFLSYSSSGWTGTEVYVILGDPNSTTFSRKLSLKFVWAF